MHNLSAALARSTAGMQAQSQRLRLISENISNADTPGYHRKLTFFSQDADTGSVQIGGVTLDRTLLPQIYAPSHPMADDTGYYAGSNVDLVIEMADSREAQRSYEANLKLFDQARQMLHSLIESLRR